MYKKPSFATPSLTVVITAYNEEDTLPDTFATAVRAVKETIPDYEILIIDDASRDGTAGVADELAKKYPKTRIIHNERNLNQGRCYLQSIQLASKEYHCLLPGDDMVTEDSLRALFRSVGKAAMSLIRITNHEMRHPLRLWISRLFVGILNFLFGLNLPYFNGPVVIKTELLKNLSLSGSYSFIAESIIPLLIRGESFVVVPMELKKRERRANLRAVRRNLFGVLKTVFVLFWRLRIRGERF